ncbi:MAG: divalent-cation tolerance protein CutA [Sulfurifustis sp.]
MTTDYQICITTCPTDDLAENLARALVEENLAACVNILPAMLSIYRWQGQIESAEERLLLIKTRVEDYAAVEKRIRAMHSYELPEVIAVPIVDGLPAYLSWLGNPDTTP